jgi:hypothetical protein
VDIPADATALVIRRRGEFLKIVERSKSIPQLQVITALQPNVRGPQTVIWSTKHAEGLPVHVVVEGLRKGSRVWERLSLATTADHTTVNLDEILGSGAMLFSLLASDGLNNTRITVAEFELPKRPCAAYIAEPVDGQKVTAGKWVLLSGQGFWPDEVRPEYDDLEWTSSVDGTLGKGNLVEVPKLTAGEHEITLRAGSGELSGTTSIKLFVS